MRDFEIKNVNVMVSVNKDVLGGEITMDDSGTCILEIAYKPLNSM
jgi:hypothetical protein